VENPAPGSSSCYCKRSSVGWVGSARAAVRAASGEGAALQRAIARKTAHDDDVDIHESPDRAFPPGNPGAAGIGTPASARGRSRGRRAPDRTRVQAVAPAPAW